MTKLDSTTLTMLYNNGMDEAYFNSLSESEKRQLIIDLLEDYERTVTTEITYKENYNDR